MSFLLFHLAGFYSFILCRLCVHVRGILESFALASSSRLP